MPPVPTVPHWIAGKPHVAADGTTSPVYNPATCAATAQVAIATESDVDDAAAAPAAFPTWSQYSLAKQSGVLFSGDAQK